MKLEQQVCNLGLAKRLKELGVKQESHFWWVNRYVTERMETIDGADGWYLTDKPKKPRLCSAFTVAELGEMLPQVYVTEKNEKYWLYMSKGATVHTVGYGYAEDNEIEYGHYEEAFTEADARAKMLIYLLENKLI